MIITRSIVTAGVATVLGAGVVLAPAAHASGGSTTVRSSGPCSSAGTWHLTAKHDDGRMEVEAEVDVNRAGRTFDWTLADNASVVRHGSATTHGPSGSFSVTRRIVDRAGKDTLVFRATRPGTVCRGTVGA